GVSGPADETAVGGRFEHLLSTFRAHPCTFRSKLPIIAESGASYGAARNLVRPGVHSRAPGGAPPGTASPRRAHPGGGRGRDPAPPAGGHGPAVHPTRREARRPLVGTHGVSRWPP